MTNAEVEYGVSRVQELLEKRAPALLPEFDRQALALRATLQAELESLRAFGKYEV
jgi:hypothetical protein